MKVLYCNPVFLDYRLPFYKQLVSLFKGDFHIMYSPTRYHLMKRDDLCERIKCEMNENAHPFKNDFMFDTATMSFNRMEMEYGQKISFTFGLIRAIRKIRPDVLVSEAFFQWTPLCLVYSILFHIPLYIGYERTCYTERNVEKLKTIYRKIVDRFTAGYFVNGNETCKYLESIGIRKEKIHIVGMSADSEGLRFSISKMNINERDMFRKRYMGDTDGLLYLFSGQIVKRKGVGFLLQAWTEHINKFSNDKLVLIGCGDLYETYKNKYKNEASIYLEGRVNYSDVYKYYAIADVFILPTIEDNWSLVIPEAMSCGLPVSTTIYNGCHSELVHEGENGYVFDCFKQESILNALDYFHHYDLKKMGQKSVELERYFNAENCAQRLYNAIMNKK